MYKKIVVTLCVSLALPGVAVMAASAAQAGGVPVPIGAPAPRTTNPGVWFNSKDGSVAGVDVKNVDWVDLCANVQPVTITAGGVTCKKVYPTSVAVRQYIDLTGFRPNEPPANCAMLEKEFVRMTTPQQGRDPWSHCTFEFTRELRSRASNTVAYDDMTFEEWRKKYFGPWIVSGGTK